MEYLCFLAYRYTIFIMTKLHSYNKNRVVICRLCTLPSVGLVTWKGAETTGKIHAWWAYSAGMLHMHPSALKALPAWGFNNLLGCSTSTCNMPSYNKHLRLHGVFLLRVQLASCDAIVICFYLWWQSNHTIDAMKAVCTVSVTILSTHQWWAYRS